MRLFEWLPTIEIRVRPSPASEARARQRARIDCEVSSLLMELCVGTEWREVQRKFPSLFPLMEVKANGDAENG